MYKAGASRRALDAAKTGNAYFSACKINKQNRINPIFHSATASKFGRRRNHVGITRPNRQTIHPKTCRNSFPEEPRNEIP